MISHVINHRYIKVINDESARYNGVQCLCLSVREDVDGAGRPLPRDLHCRATGDVQIALTGQFRRWRFAFIIVI